jgi:hypothetical protein
MTIMNKRDETLSDQLTQLNNNLSTQNNQMCNNLSLTSLKHIDSEKEKS